jgi:hypothetical protein
LEVLGEHLVGCERAGEVAEYRCRAVVIVPVARPGGVAEHRTKRDLVGIGQLGEPPCDRFVEPDTAFVDELGRGRGNEGAGDLGDREGSVGRHWSLGAVVHSGRGVDVAVPGKPDRHGRPEGIRFASPVVEDGLKGCCVDLGVGDRGAALGVGSACGAAVTAPAEQAVVVSAIATAGTASSVRRDERRLMTGSLSGAIDLQRRPPRSWDGAGAVMAW